MIVQGVYHPLSRGLLRRRSAIEEAIYAMVAGTIMTLPIAPVDWTQLILASGSAWLGAVYRGLLPSALGFVLSGYAVARMPVVASTSLLYRVPAVGGLISFCGSARFPLPSELLGASRSSSESQRSARATESRPGSLRNASPRPPQT
ncbi:hypothetical protein GCM10011399_15550 [Subtercola lobariae]|uniref:EamA domain-containing protein n=2 Tax=Subtercola lobariae TaxID=1588641 RepID=A0A917B4B3_9MICO|nr:hypothetical protein GCM10011399_15550 [Subtercola lobariae]